MIINAINGNGNRLIRVNKDTNKDAVKEFLVTTLSQCDTKKNIQGDMENQIKELMGTILLKYQTMSLLYQ